MRLLIDTDAGVDDAVAIMLALHAFPHFDEVVALTTVFGNVHLPQANHNVAEILKVMDRSNIPVYSGAARPIIASVSDERWQGHGPDGLGGESGAVDLSPHTTQRNEAVQALVDLAHKHKGELVILALGPLTNLALAALIDPSFLTNVKQLIVMGGLSRGEGNFTPYSEFNVGCDPEATSIVYQYSTAEKLHVVPFETCTDHSLTWETFEAVFHELTNSNGLYVRRIWNFTKEFFANEGFVPCDAYAVAILLHPEYVISSQILRGSIHLAPDEQRGASLWDDSEAALKHANVTLVTKVNDQIFVDLLHRMCLVVADRAEHGVSLHATQKIDV